MPNYRLNETDILNLFNSDSAKSKLNEQVAHALKEYIEKVFLAIDVLNDGFYFSLDEQKLKRILNVAKVNKAGLQLKVGEIEQIKATFIYELMKLDFTEINAAAKKYATIRHANHAISTAINEKIIKLIEAHPQLNDIHHFTLEVKKNIAAKLTLKDDALKSKSIVDRIQDADKYTYKIPPANSKSKDVKEDKVISLSPVVSRPYSPEELERHETLTRFKVNYYLADAITQFKKDKLAEIDKIGTDFYLSDELITKAQDIFLQKLKNINFLDHYVSLKDKDDLRVSDQQKFNKFIINIYPEFANMKTFIESQFPADVMGEKLEKEIENITKLLEKYKGEKDFVATSVSKINKCLNQLQINRLNKENTEDKSNAILNDIKDILGNLKKLDHDHYKDKSFAFFRKQNSKLRPLLTEVNIIFENMKSTVANIKQLKDRMAHLGQELNAKLGKGAGRFFDQTIAKQKFKASGPVFDYLNMTRGGELGREEGSKLRKVMS